MVDDAEKRGRPNHLKVRRWKITIPVALVGAITAPLVFGTWKMQPTSETWVPLTADQKAKLGTYMQNTENCRTFEATVGDKVFCDMELAKLRAGGEYQYLYLSTPKYFALNFATALGAFIAVFGLTFSFQTWFAVIGSASSRSIISTRRLVEKAQGNPARSRGAGARGWNRGWPRPNV